MSEDSRYSAPVGESYAGMRPAVGQHYTRSQNINSYRATLTLNTCCCGVDIRKGKNKKQRKEERTDRMERKKNTKATNSERS